MKKYEAPIVELTKFDVEDVITTSGAPTVTEVDVRTDSFDAAQAKTDITGADATLKGVFTW